MIAFSTYLKRIPHVGKFTMNYNNGKRAVLKPIPIRLRQQRNADEMQLRRKKIFYLHDIMKTLILFLAIRILSLHLDVSE